MGARGPRSKPAEVYKMRGTYQPTRHPGGDLGTDPEDYAPTLPRWVKGAAARRYWRAKVAEYERRGQRLEGFEDALGDYCMLLAKLERLHREGEAIPAPLRSALFRYYALFYDTPADAVAAGPKDKAKPGNPFADRGKRPG